jgi:geranylgeranylglycerol-phosphate geranylgeranyltransferase
MDRLLDTIRLLRPFNGLLAMLGVWIGAYLTWHAPLYYAPAIAGLAAFLICAAGNAINDLVDIEIDRVNRPQRVLVKGTLSRRYVFWLAHALNLVSVGLALTVSYEITALALATIGLLHLYNYRLKRVPLVGNVTISLLAGLTFVTGGIAIDPYFAFDLPGPLIGFVFAFCFHLVREIIKDVEDIAGDQAAGIRTLPQVIGIGKALVVVLAVFVVLILLTFMPALLGWFGKWYKIIAVYIVELPLLAFLIFLWGNPSVRMLKIGSRLLKAGMVMGMAALLAG